MKKILNKIFNLIINDNEKEYFLFHKDRYQKMLFLISRLTKKNCNILDAGCGFCNLLVGCHFLGESNLYGIDNFKSSNVFENKIKNLKINYKYCDFFKDNIPYSNEYFDLIIFSEVIEHFNFYPQRFMSELYRILKPGGKIIITTPNLVRLNNRIKMLIGKSTNYDIKINSDLGAHYREYTAKEIEYLAQRSGFNNIKITYEHFNYPNVNYFVNYLNVLIGFFISTIRSNLVIICEK